MMGVIKERRLVVGGLGGRQVAAAVVVRTKEDEVEGF
jgi:hypothetical protein